MNAQVMAKDIFLRAIERPEPEWPAFLDEMCADSEELRHRVEALLHAYEGGGPFLEHPTMHVPATTMASGRAAEFGDRDDLVGPDSMIGPYKLLQLIGEGGFGVVYMAEQQEPVRRRVALKIIKLGMDTREVIARFEAERQALAMMDHPNIARVFDAGATEFGRPYFVMELVRGISITSYCDQNNLTTEERIDLFGTVCHAVQHAHQKGVIHRDLKPGNVLVTLHDGKPVPKIIDFGIAKAINQRLTEKTLFTDFHQFIGTPQYMSPEQAELSGLDVDTRADIYSLGVLLYELLTGTTPFDPGRFRAAALGEIQRIIREDDPPRPSTRLSTIGEALTAVADRRRTSADRLSRCLRRDLDWVVMKAIEKDRTRRYESADAFARDIHRYLNDEPVLAGPPTVTYKLRKFVRRHRVMVTTTAVVALVAVLAAVAIAMAGGVAMREGARAERNARIADLTNEFLIVDLLGQADPMQQPDRELSLRAVLDAASQKIEGRFDAEPLVEASIRSTLGQTYMGLGEYDVAELHLAEAQRLTEQSAGDDTSETRRARHDVAQLYWRAGRYAEAEAFARPLLAEYTKSEGAEHEETIAVLDILALSIKGKGRLDEAEPLLVEVYRVRRDTLGAEHPDTLSALSNLGMLYKDQGRYDEAATALEETLDVRRRTLGGDHLHTLSSMGNLALVYQLQGRYDDTEPLCRQVLEVRKRVLGPEHPQTLGAMNNLGFLYTKQERHEDARPYYEHVLAVRRRTLGDDHWETLLSINNLGFLYTKLDRTDEAEPLLDELLERTRRTLGATHADFYRSLSTMAGLYMKQGRTEEAEATYRAMLEGYRAVLPDGHPDIGRGLAAWARSLAALDRNDEARVALQDAVKRLRESLGPDHVHTKRAEASLRELDG